MKIISLTASNIKRLTAVEIRPDGNLVEIAGRNGQGKTSILDSIWWALENAKNIQAQPIHRGAKEASIKLELGDHDVVELTVLREFEAKGPAYTTKLTVRNERGVKLPSPAAVLQALIGELSFDPLAFARSKADEQFAVLRRFVPDVDFDALEDANKKDFEARTGVNRRAKELQAQAEGIKADMGVGDDLKDETELLEKLTTAAEHNSVIEKRANRREAMREEIKALGERARRERDDANRLRSQADLSDARADDLAEEAMQLGDKLDEAEPLPALIDVDDMRTRIEAARRHNEAVGLRQRRLGLMRQAQAAREESEALTVAMVERDEKAEAAIAGAAMPIDGLGFLKFGDAWAVTLDGEPFNQASDAEQLRASVAIAMRLNPKLRVIRIRDGSLLDETSMAMLADMLDGDDWQCWIERVDSSGAVGFVIEDGRLRSPKESSSNG